MSSLSDTENEDEVDARFWRRVGKANRVSGINVITVGARGASGDRALSLANREPRATLPHIPPKDS